ncbi:MAG TPA: hypothetical protein VJZ01_13505 [Lachnospiraceae bacterium]|jgi:hypothetical protein|nr:hypothetical protein [Lachnospiraceae bacterium]
MAKKQKKNSKKPNSKTNQKTKKKGGSIFLKITAVLAALILIPTIALTGLILYAGTTGTVIEVPAPLQSLLKRISVSENEVGQNEVSGNATTTDGNVLNVAGISENSSGSQSNSYVDTQQINLVYNNDIVPTEPVREPVAEPEQTVSENAADSSVWVTPAGLKYHIKANCGDTDSVNAIEETLLYALDEGYVPCETCYPNGNAEAEEAAYNNQ